VEKLPYKDLASKGMDKSNVEALQFAYYVLASINDAMSLKDAFRCHKIVISWAKNGGQALTMDTRCRLKTTG